MTGGLAYFGEDMLGDVDGQDRGDAEGDRIAWPAIDLDGFPVEPDVNFGEECVVLEVVDLDLLHGAAHGLDDVGEEIVGHGTGGSDTLEAAVDGHGFIAAD